MLFLFVISLRGFSQDSIQLFFGSETKGNCDVVVPANGWYQLNSYAHPKIELPRTFYFDPQIAKDISPQLHLYAFQKQITNTPNFPYQTFEWKEITREEYIQKIIECSGDSTLRYQPDQWQFYGENCGLQLNRMSEWARQTQNKEAQESDPNQSIRGGTILDGVFLDQDTYYQKIPYRDLYPEFLDSLNRVNQNFRKTQVQPIVDSLLHPFYLSEMEVRNVEYRAFTNWVRDSIARELLYANLSNAKEAASYVCDCDTTFNKKEFDRKQVRDHCRLNWEKKLVYTDVANVDILAPLYDPEPERFYKRREIRSDIYVYQSDRGEQTNVYPDTTPWRNLFGPVGNMYFWHPAYDDYPVTCVNYEQIQAFLEWKEKQVNRGLKSGRIEVRLPSLYHYEIAAKYTFDYLQQSAIVDVPNAFFTQRMRSYPEWGYYLVQVFQNADLNRTDEKTPNREEQRFYRWYEERFNKRFHYLTGNVSEITADQITPEALEYYQMPESNSEVSEHFVVGENFLYEVNGVGIDSYNSVFYKQAQPDKSGNFTTGFRLLYIFHEDSEE